MGKGLAVAERFSFRDAALSSGEAVRQDLQLDLDPYLQGGIEFPFERPVPARLDVSAMISGYAMRLRLDAKAHGPCARCLEDTHFVVVVDSHEVHDPAAGDPELVSDFVAAEELDVAGWAQDAVGLEFPTRVLCRDDCAGLCPVCGIDRNTNQCECVVEARDTRWDKLRDVSFDD